MNIMSLYQVISIQKAFEKNLGLIKEYGIKDNKARFLGDKFWSALCISLIEWSLENNNYKNVIKLNEGCKKMDYNMLAQHDLIDRFKSVLKQTNLNPKVEELYSALKRQINSYQAAQMFLKNYVRNQGINCSIVADLQNKFAQQKIANDFQVTLIINDNSSNIIEKCKDPIGTLTLVKLNNNWFYIKEDLLYMSQQLSQKRINGQINVQPEREEIQTRGSVICNRCRNFQPPDEIRIFTCSHTICNGCIKACQQNNMWSIYCKEPICQGGYIKMDFLSPTKQNTSTKQYTQLCADCDMSNQQLQQPYNSGCKDHFCRNCIIKISNYKQSISYKCNKCYQNLGKYNFTDIVAPIVQVPQQSFGKCVQCEKYSKLIEQKCQHLTCSGCFSSHAFICSNQAPQQVKNQENGSKQDKQFPQQQQQPKEVQKPANLRNSQSVKPQIKELPVPNGYQIQNGDYISDSQMIQKCQVCLNKYPSNQIFMNTFCGHKWCFNCTLDKLQNNGQCYLYRDCKKPINLPQLNNFYEKGSEDKMTEESNKNQQNNIHRCSTCGYKTKVQVLKNQEIDYVKCGNCQSIDCYKHKERLDECQCLCLTCYSELQTDQGLKICWRCGYSWCIDCKQKTQFRLSQYQSKAEIIQGIVSKHQCENKKQMRQDMSTTRMSEESINVPKIKIEQNGSTRQQTLKDKDRSIDDTVQLTQIKMKSSEKSYKICPQGCQQQCQCPQQLCSCCLDKVEDLLLSDCGFHKVCFQCSAQELNIGCIFCKGELPKVYNKEAKIFPKFEVVLVPNYQDQQIKIDQMRQSKQEDFSNSRFRQSSAAPKFQSKIGSSYINTYKY